MHEIEQPVLLFFEAGAFALQLAGQFALAGLVVAQRGLDCVAELVDKRAGEPDFGVEVADFPFHQRDGQMRQVARAGRLVHAFVVAVSAAVAGHLGVDQPTATTELLAPIAEQTAFEVVRELVVVDCRVRADLEDVLDAIEQIAQDERLVPTFEHFSVVDGVARVVRVAQHAVNGVVAEWSAGLPSSEGPGAEPEIFGRFDKVFERVVAGRIQLEDCTD